MGTCTKGQYKGEKCFKPPTSYPYTKGGTVNVGRIRNAAARAAQNGDVATIKAGGFCGVASRNGVKSKLCGKSK
jgi:hypothetical protein